MYQKHTLKLDTGRTVEVELVVCEWCGRAQVEMSRYGEHLGDVGNIESYAPSDTCHLCRGCHQRALAFALRCKQAGFVNKDDEIELKACRDCGTRFGSEAPHVADGLCVNCAPPGTHVCHGCHNVYTPAPGEVENAEYCSKCASAAT